MKIKIISGSLYNWCFDNEISEVIPDAYKLTISFHDEIFTAYFSVKDLLNYKKDETLYSCFTSTESDLLDSFENKIENDEDTSKEIFNYCDYIWKNDSDFNKYYNFLGERTNVN